MKKILIVFMCFLLLTGNAYMEELSKIVDLSEGIKMEDLPDIGIRIIDEEILEGHLLGELNSEWFEQAVGDYQNPESVLANVLSILYHSEALENTHEEIPFEKYIEMWEMLGYDLKKEQAEYVDFDEETKGDFYWKVYFSDDVVMHLYPKRGDSQILDEIEFNIIIPELGEDIPIRFSYDV